MDPAYLARAVGYPATGVEVMAQRAGRVVARVDTMDEPAILKADGEEPHPLSAEAPPFTLRQTTELWERR